MKWPMVRMARATVIGAVAALLVVWGTLWLADAVGNPLAAAAMGRISSLFGFQAKGVGAVPLGVQVGGPFHLVDQHGTAVTDADYRGRWMLVYFGYTFCPDVCPTELQTMATAVAKLGPDAAKVAPLFITVDPERDTPEVLARYLKLFGEGLIGLTGTPAEIADVARQYRVYYARVTPDHSPYVMDHSSFVYLMDPKGRLAALFDQGTSPDKMASGIEERLSQRS
jgi:cytochrome oxidase Cu insertion factor (SCO1/SenC/PrrC family)